MRSVSYSKQQARGQGAPPLLPEATKRAPVIHHGKHFHDA